VPIGSAEQAGNQLASRGHFEHLANRQGAHVGPNGLLSPRVADGDFRERLCAKTRDSLSRPPGGWTRLAWSMTHTTGQASTEEPAARRAHRRATPGTESPLVRPPSVDENQQTKKGHACLQEATSRPPEYRQVRLSVRPIRVAVVMPDTEGWIPQARRVMENFSRTWGGSGDLLIACKPDGSVSEMSWRLLELFDPDRFAHYVPTYQGFKRANPEGFKEWVRREARRLARKSGGTAAEWRSRLDEPGFLSNPRSTWRPPDETSAEALERLSPLHFEEHVFQDASVADETPQYHFVDMALLEPVAPHSPIILPEVESIPDELALVFDTRYGQLAPSYEEVLATKGVETRRSPPSDTWLSLAVQQAWLGEPHRTSLAWLADDEPEPRWMLQEEQSNTPFGRTLVGCSVFRPWLSRWDDRPFVFVIGNSLEDYAWALSLDRLTGAAAWVPERLLRPRNARLANVLFRAMVGVANTVSGYGHDARKVLVISASISNVALEKALKAASRASYLVDSPFELSTPMEILASVDELRGVERILDVEHNEVIRYEPFVDGRQATALATPVPSAMPVPPTTKMTWFVDADVEGHRVPARSRLSGLVADPDFIDRDVRAGRDGVSYFSQTGFIATGMSLDKTLSRPRLRLPTALTVLRKLLPDGWAFDPSQSGRYARAMLNLLGGMDRVKALLLDPSTFRLLNAFLAKSRSGDDPGVFLDPVERRYLCFDDAATVSDLATSEVRTLLDDLLLKGVIDRGLVLDCGTCSYDGWYPIGEVGTSFRCPRCRDETPLTKETWRQPPTEPMWFYALSEVVYQFLANNGHAPLLALGKLKERTRAFMFEPEMHISDGAGWTCELDLWVIRDGRIAIGEAKTTAKLGTPAETERLIENLRRSAKAIRADEIVIATTKGSWHSSVEPKVRKAFANTHQRLIVMSDLLS